MASAISAASNVGDIINVVADDGPLLMSGTTPGTITGHAGSSYASFGLKIRGVDNASENPARAELRFDDDTNTQTMFDLSTGTPSYIILQGLFVDWTAITSTVSSKHFFDRGGISNQNQFVEYCHFVLGENQSGGIWLDPTPVSSLQRASGEFRYNYIVDSGTVSGALMNAYQRGSMSVHHNVWYMSGAWSQAQTLWDCNNNDGAGTDHRFYNNTIYAAASPLNLGSIWVSNDPSGAASGVPVKHVHSNVVGGPTARPLNYVAGNASASGQEGDYTRLFGYSLFYLPNATFPSWGYYQIPWDPDDSDSPEGDDVWSTDVIAASDPFNNATTSWTWENINGSGYDTVLAGDWRIVDEGTNRTMSQSGGVPGAIDDAPAVPSDPPDFVPDNPPDGPITPDTPGYFLDPDVSPGDRRSGIQCQIRLRKNLDIEGNFRFIVGGSTNITSKIVSGTIILDASTTTVTIPGLNVTGIKKLMIEPDGDTNVTLDSHVQLVKAGGCLLVVEASGVNSIQMNNPSPVRELRVHFFGSK